MTAIDKVAEIADALGIDSQPDVYTGPAKRWIVYNYTYQNGREFADDAPQADVSSVQVHFYAPVGESTTKLQKQIRNALFDAGFTYPDITIEREEKYRHIIFECDIEEEREA